MTAESDKNVITKSKAAAAFAPTEPGKKLTHCVQYVLFLLVSPDKSVGFLEIIRS